MEEFNFEKIEKKLKDLSAPDFELSEHKRMLRHALLNSPYFEKRGVGFIFRVLAPSVGAVVLILLFVFFGYPYLQYFYLEAKAEGILDKTEEAIEKLGPGKEIYAIAPEKTELATGLSSKVEEKIISPEALEKLGTASQPPLSPDQKLIKIELQLNQLKAARTRGEIKFLQHVGEEERNGLILDKIRYLDRNNIIIEIRINRKTNLPIEIVAWNFQKEIKKPELIRNILPEKEAVSEIKIIEPSEQIQE